jgi:hypothetical protein
MMFLFFSMVVAVQVSMVVCQALPFIITGALTRYQIPPKYPKAHPNIPSSATAKPGTAINRGGSVTIDGFTILIPDNLLVELPALCTLFSS